MQKHTAKLSIILFLAAFLLGGFTFPPKAHAGLIVKLPTSLGLATGLVGYWPFNGPDISGATAYDRSGSSPANNGIIHGAVKTVGKLGQALKYDGTNDYVDAGNNISIQLGKTGTVSLWFKAASSFSDSTGEKKTLMYGGPWEFYFSGDSSLLLYYLSDGMANVSSNRTSWDTNWHFVSVTSDGITAYMYIDGVRQTSSASLGSLNFFANIENLTFGESNNDSFSGTIDDVRVYNRALSKEEIRRLYNMGGGLIINKTPANSLTTGLVGYWTFDDSDIYENGTVAADKTANHNTGTITGATPAIGKLGQALKFDGSNDYVQITRTAALEPSTVTVSTWVYIRDGTNNQWIVMKNKSLNTSYALDIGYHNADYLEFCNDNYLLCAEVLPTGYTNRWIHLVGTYDGTNNNLYINGTLVNQHAGGALDYTGPDNLFGSFRVLIG